MIKTVFLDLDDTILDFGAGEAAALSRSLREIGVEPTGAVVERYHAINEAHWKLLEKGEMTRAQLLTHRFEQLFEELGVTASAEDFWHRYEGHLSRQCIFLPGGREVVETLASSYDLYIASNGTATVQHPRLDASGLRPYLKGVFISQEMGANKPSPAFFAACFAAIPDFRLEEAIIVGDSLSSDIRGGASVGLRTCWFNPHGKPVPEEPGPDHVITALEELPALLASL